MDGQDRQEVKGPEYSKVISPVYGVVSEAAEFEPTEAQPLVIQDYGVESILPKASHRKRNLCIVSFCSAALLLLVVFLLVSGMVVGIVLLVRGVKSRTGSEITRECPARPYYYDSAALDVDPGCCQQYNPTCCRPAACTAQSEYVSLFVPDTRISACERSMNDLTCSVCSPDVQDFAPDVNLTLREPCQNIAVCGSFCDEAYRSCQDAVPWTLFPQRVREVYRWEQRNDFCEQVMCVAVRDYNCFAGDASSLRSLRSAVVALLFFTLCL